MPESIKIVFTIVPGAIAGVWVTALIIRTFVTDWVLNWWGFPTVMSAIGVGALVACGVGWILHRYLFRTI